MVQYLYRGMYMFEKTKLRKYADSMLGYVYETDKKKKMASIRDDFQYTTAKFYILKFYLIIFNPRKGKIDLVKLKPKYYTTKPDVPYEIDSFEVIDMDYYKSKYQTDENFKKALELQNEKANKRIWKLIRHK